MSYHLYAAGGVPVGDAWKLLVSPVGAAGAAMLVFACRLVYGLAVAVEPITTGNPLAPWR